MNAPVSTKNRTLKSSQAEFKSESALDSAKAFDIAKSSELLGGPTWLQDRRKTFVKELSDISWPTSSEEQWRYSDIENFNLDDYRALSIGELGNPGEGFSPGGGILAAQAGENAGLIVMKNGRVVHYKLDESLVDQGVLVMPIAELEGANLDLCQKYIGSVIEKTSDTFSVLTEAMTCGGAFIYVPKNVVIEKPIIVLHWREGDGTAAFPRTLLVAESSSSVNVIERFESSDEKLFISSITECVVKANASVKFLTIQENGKNTFHVGTHRTTIDADARYDSSTVALGSKYARNRSEVVLAGKGAASKVVAVYYGDSEQVLDFRTYQDHVAEHTHSDLLFKGAVEQNAKSIYSGLIRIREGAQHSKAYQTNRNLVLDHGAQAESIPNLVIEANEVQCSHGSTVGPIDEEQMYYLQSRGVSKAEAERLIVLGFFEDVFSRLSIPSLIEPLRISVKEKLASLSVEK